MLRIAHFILLAFLSSAIVVACGSPASGIVPEPTVTTPVNVVPPSNPGMWAQVPISEPTPAPNVTGAIATSPVSTSSAGSPTASAAMPASPPSPPLAATTPATSSRQNRVMLGYYVPYDATSWQTLEARASLLDLVSAQVVSIDPCGGIGSRDDRTLMAFTRARGIRLVPSLLTSDQTLNHRLLTDQAVRDRTIEQIISYVVDEGYDGFDLDLEDVMPADRHAYTAFVAQLSKALHDRGKLLMAALPAKHYDATTGWAGAFDYAALGPHLDYAMIMTYDYSWSSSPPGSIAPYDWVEKVIAYVASQMPRQKVLLGAAFYGYDWNTTAGGRARALTFNQAAALAAKYGVKLATDSASQSATFGYTAKLGDTLPAAPQSPALKHDIAVRKPPACNQPLPTATPAPPRPTARPTSTPAPVQRHVVWLEDATSFASRLELADRLDVGGVGAWRLGQEDPAAWAALEKLRQGRR